MRPSRIIVVDVARQHMTQVPLSEHDDVVKALSSDRTYQPPRVAILPGRTWRCRMIAAAKGTKAANEKWADFNAQAAPQRSGRQ